MNLLFWLSLFPFVTSWVAGSDFAQVPVVLYGTVLLMASIAWPILMVQLITCNGGRQGQFGHAMGNDTKGKLSLAAYFIAIPLAFVAPRISCLIYAATGLMWLIPDCRIEKKVFSQ
jgi:uncharacterized membrane protein